MQNGLSAKSLVHFLAPTASGSLMYAVITGLVWLTHDIDAIRHYFQIPDDASLGRDILSLMNTALVHVLGAHVNTVVLGLLWAMVGLVVYVVTMEIIRGFAELREGVQARHYIWASNRNRNQPLEGWLARTGVRLGAFLASIFYLVFVVSYATDWQVGTSTVWQQWLTSHQVCANVFLVAVSLVVWHGLAVLLRLITLRARLFG